MNIPPTDLQELESEDCVVRSVSAKQVMLELQKSFLALSVCGANLSFPSPMHACMNGY